MFCLINYYGIMILIHFCFLCGLFLGVVNKKAKLTISFVAGVVMISVLWPLWWVWWFSPTKKRNKRM